jgi:hypothetical protein
VVVATGASFAATDFDPTAAKDTIPGGTTYAARYSY